MEKARNKDKRKRVKAEPIDPIRFQVVETLKKYEQRIEMRYLNDLYFDILDLIFRNQNK